MNTLLRRYVRHALREVLEGPHISNVISTKLAKREQMGSLAGDGDEIASHLQEPEVDVEDCYGPVPPMGEEPGVFADPYTVNYHVLPTSPSRSTR